jgi:hypothetical protein
MFSEDEKALELCNIEIAASMLHHILKNLDLNFGLSMEFLGAPNQFYCDMFLCFVIKRFNNLENSIRILLSLVITCPKDPLPNISSTSYLY